jgi:hypothetical protein
MTESYRGIPQTAIKKLGRDVFSTGQIAKILGTSSRTVACWIDKGELIGYKLPGVNVKVTDRRVLRHHLIDFCCRLKIPLPAMFQSSTPRVLVYTDNINFVETLYRLLLKDFEVVHHASTAALSIDAAGRGCAVIVVDVGKSGMYGGRVLRKELGDISKLAGAKWIALMGEDHTNEQLDNFDTQLTWPHSPSVVADFIKNCFPVERSEERC